MTYWRRASTCPCLMIFVAAATARGWRDQVLRTELANTAFDIVFIVSLQFGHLKDGNTNRRFNGPM